MTRRFERQELRECRVHHWKRALSASASLTKYERLLRKAGEFDAYNKRYANSCIRIARKAWVTHMGFVQALNELFDTSKGDTAEHDLARGIGA